jgi:fructuronate reductase
MKLNDIFSGNYNANDWEAKGYELPKFDIKAVREKTAK